MAYDVLCVVAMLVVKYIRIMRFILRMSRLVAAQLYSQSTAIHRPSRL